MKQVFSAAGKAIIGTLFEGTSKLISNFKADPTKVAELEAGLSELNVQAQTKMQELEVQLSEIEAKQLETVNATMREEAKSEHWAQWLWRPMVGFTFCAVIINNYILVPYLKKYGVELIQIPDGVWNSMLVVLGATAAGRGLTKYQEAKNK